MHKLIGKIDYQIWMILYRYYWESIAFVHMDGENLSEIFTTTNGVKQGGPLSPRLFAIYIEDLSEIVNRSWYAAKIKGI